MTTKSRSPSPPILDSVSGEIAFFRAMMRTRPVGIHRFFHVLAMQIGIRRDTGHIIPTDAIWEKLRSCYDMEALEAIDLEAETNFLQSTNASPVSVHARSPSPSANLTAHPFFRGEYTLPADEVVESLISQRRMRASASVASSPAAGSPPRRGRGGSLAGRGKKRERRDLAGLVGGDSDSSALTQESGDEGRALDDEDGKAEDGEKEVGRDSVVTGTDGGTEDVEDEDVEMRDPQSETSLVPSAPSPGPRPRGRPKSTIKRGRGATSRGASTPAPTRGTKKRKRGG